MQNKCSNCSAPLAAGQMLCPYCDIARADNSNEALLDDLLKINCKYETAYARGDKMALGELLADEFVLTQVDADETLTCTKQQLLDVNYSDKYFFSYSASGEMLLKRTDETAEISCIGNLCRVVPANDSFPDGDDNNYFRTKSGFVRRGGRWQLVSQHTTTVDSNGNEYTV